MNTTQLPLLIKGYNSDLSGSNSSFVATAGAVQWNNVLDSGRGNLVALDAIQTGAYQFFGRNSAALVTISLAGIQVISGSDADDFAPIAHPGDYFIMPINQPGGQTLSLNLGTSSGNNGLQVLAFYENKYATPDWKQKLLYSKLKRRTQTFFQTILSNTNNQFSQDFTVPQSQGNVVGVELTSYINSVGNLTDLGTSTITVFVNGTTIFENVLVAYGAKYCTRPQLFPIFIPGGTTIRFQVNAGNALAAPSFVVGLKLYFDATND
jgi:hypothetical protein